MEGWAAFSKTVSAQYVNREYINPARAKDALLIEDPLTHSHEEPQKVQSKVSEIGGQAATPISDFLDWS